MNFENISDTQLITNLKQTVATERETTVKILWLLREVEHRMLYASRGYPSLFAYCVSELKYSDSATQRRISAMRLLRDLTEEARAQIEKKIADGELNLSHLSQVQQHCRKEALKTKEDEKAKQKENTQAERTREQECDQAVMTFENVPNICLTTKPQPLLHSRETLLQEKLALIGKVSNTSTRECERVLASLSSEPAQKKETVRAVGTECSREAATDSRVSFVIPGVLMEKIERIQNARAHQLKGKSILELLTFLVNEEVKRDDKKKGLDKKHMVATTAVSHAHSAPEVQNETSPDSNTLTVESTLLNHQKHQSAIKTQTRYIKRNDYRTLYKEADHQCQFTDSITGKRCGSRYKLQVEHCLPFALGGTNDLGNLKLLCSTHNALNARRVFGEQAVQNYSNVGNP